MKKLLIILILLPFMATSQGIRPTVNAGTLNGLTVDSLVQTTAITQTILGTKKFTGTLTGNVIISSMFIGDYDGSTTDNTNLVHNLYDYANPNWKYKHSAAASLISQGNGRIGFFTVPSGTAGATIQPTRRMDINDLGQISIGFGLTPISAISNSLLTIGNQSGAVALVDNLSFGSCYGTTIAGGLKIKLNEGVTNESSWGIGWSGPQLDYYLGNTAASHVFSAITTGELLRIEGTGNVGINNNSPSEKLDVIGNIAVSGTVDGIDVFTNVTANNAKISFDATSSARLANTSGTNTGNQTLTGLNYEPTGTAASLMSTHTTTHPIPTTRDARNQVAGSYQAAGTYNTIIGTDTDINNGVNEHIDQIVVTDGVITSMSKQVMSAGDIGAATTAHTHTTYDATINTSGATVMDELTVLNGIVTKADTRTITRADLGLTTWVNEVSNGSKTTSVIHYANTDDIGAYRVSTTSACTVKIYNLSAGMQGTIFLNIITKPSSLTIATYSNAGSTGLTERVIGAEAEIAASKTTTITYTCASDGTTTYVYLIEGQQE